MKIIYINCQDLTKNNQIYFIIKLKYDVFNIIYINSSNYSPHLLFTMSLILNFMIFRLMRFMFCHISFIFIHIN